MSKFAHNICEKCWSKKIGFELREAVRIKVAVLAEKCCFCGKDNRDGIYVVVSPAPACAHSHEAVAPQ